MKTKKLPVFCFDVDTDLMIGTERLTDVLGFKIGDGIRVRAEKGDRVGVSLHGGEATVCYTRKNLFFRGLGLLVEHAAAESDFDLFEDGFFESLSAMIDVSRCGVPTLSSVRDMLDHMAVMGYDTAMLYTEDLIKLEGRPYFGYMRGRYLPEELRALDDYAYAYGIEMIPCLECYGHMEKYLIWGEAFRIKDTESVLMAREEKTFEFLDKLIGTASSCFRSRRIHVGMDEAFDMGRGKFLTKHGYVPPFDIFNEYMDRLMEIVNKYGLSPMMWSDMYFRVSSGNNRYYGEDIEIPPEVAAKIPQNMELIFWHYGECPGCDDYMLKKHAALKRRISYAGGLWCWSGHFPEHRYMMESVRTSLDACRSHGVRSAMATIWFNDNAECDLHANLFGLSFLAELCFDKNASADKLKARFEATTGGDYDAFLTMGLYHNTFGENDTYDDFNQRFYGKAIFWQDVLEGLYDTHLWKKPMSGHYTACAAAMKGYKNKKWQYLYDFAYRVFDFLSLKALIAEQLVPAYQNGDRDALAHIAHTLLPNLKKKTAAVHKAHKAVWMSKRNMLGWSNLDIRYGGMAARCDTATQLIHAYLEGKISAIESLEEQRLYKPLTAFPAFSKISSPNIKT